VHAKRGHAWRLQLIDEAKPDETETAWVLARATAAGRRWHSGLDHKILFVWEDHGSRRSPWPQLESIASASLYPRLAAT